MTEKKISVPIREGKPSQCIACGQKLHPKSEFYCSIRCYESLISGGKEKPPFLSKWKIRKRKAAKDPLIGLRKKARNKTKALLEKGKLVRRPCVVCQSQDVLPHHEDYANPFHIIWLCQKHHDDYHDGKITLFNGRLRWHPMKLIPKGYQGAFPQKKYMVPKAINTTEEIGTTNNFNHHPSTSP